jgi:hypothetical protein
MGRVRMNSIRGCIVKVVRANGRATTQSREFRRTYGIERARIGQDRRTAEKTKFGEKNRIRRFPAPIRGRSAPPFLTAIAEASCATTNKQARAAWEPPHAGIHNYLMAILELCGLEIAAEFYFGNLVLGKIYFSCLGFGRKLDPVAGDLGDDFSLTDHANLSPAVVYF